MEDHYGRSGDEEDLCKKIVLRLLNEGQKGAACASVSGHFGATRN